MNCLECQQNMQLYLDDETFSDRIDFENHIIECQDCVGELNSLKKSTTIFSNSLKPAKSEELVNVWQQIELQISPEKPMVTNQSESYLEKLLSLIGLIKRPAFAMTAVLVVLSVLMIKLFSPIEVPDVAVVTEPIPTKTISDYPVVEKVNKADVSVLTMNTSDPHIKVVWFFDDKLKM